MITRFLLSICILLTFLNTVNAGVGVKTESARIHLLNYTRDEGIIEKIDVIIDKLPTEQLDILIEKTDTYIHKYKDDSFYIAVFYYIQLKALDLKNTVSVEVGDSLSVHYTGYFNDGEIFDSSLNRDSTLDFTAGVGQMIPGFDQAVLGMTIGEKKTVVIPPSEGYGEYSEERVQYIARSELQSFVDIGFKLEIGEVLPTQYGEFEILSSNDTGVFLDMNHPFVGKTLKFDIEIIDIQK